jgi:putative Ca2+/H+ antiporter (TMEM165/GDT1 family)
MLFAGASIGAWLGVHLTYNIKRRYIHFVSACIVFLMAFRMAFKFFSSSYTQIFMNTSQNLSKSFIFQFVSEKPMLYTAICIFLICAVAFTSEKFMQMIADKRKLLERGTKKK